MIAPARVQDHEPHHFLQGWVGSLFFHAAMATIALMMMSAFRMPSQPETFRWNVALVEPPPPVPTVAKPPQPTPPKPKPTPISEPVQPQPVMQTVQQRVVQTVQAVQQVVQREVVQAVRTTAAVTTVNHTASVVTQAVQQTEPTQVAAPTAIAASTAVSRESVVHEAPLVTASTAAVQQAAAPVMTESVAAQPTVASVHERPAFEQAVQASVTQAIPTKSIPAAKADFGWLAASLWERIQKDMKNRYPYLARVNRLEGQVLLTVVVKADGSLSDIKVKTSSGHAILDRDAEAFLASLSPLRLKHSLGKASQLVEVPISYSLRG